MRGRRKVFILYMYLKRIVMQGFKSFANKMTFEFPEGITGIVGPNGSGKSNVADAVRWVLGEQSAKQLRGGNMQDVIFAGTEARKPLSFASVDITFDNSDHALDTSYTEVTVTRRLYRSGESEYKINGRTVRLKDIHELFYDTGIGKEGYSIIGQGQIERIVSGKADERRELFDEAAGIVKFKRRKNATLKKLAEEQQNLVRVNDILSELGGQLGPLKRQSETARIYLDKRERQKALDINLFLIDNDSIDGQLAELTEKIGITEADTADTTRAFEQTKAEYERVENEIIAADAELTALQNKIRQDELTRQQLRGQMAILKEQINTIVSNSEHFSDRTGQIDTEIERREDERISLREDEKDLAAELAEAEKTQAIETKKLSDLDGKLAQMNAGIASGKNNVIEVLNSRANVRGRMQRYDAMLEQIGIRRSEISARMLRFKEEENESRREIEAADEKLLKIRAEISALKARSEDKDRAVGTLQNEIRDLNAKLDGDTTAFHRDASRLESLTALTEHYEGYSNGVRRVMEQKNRNPGILGVVADLISTEEKYELAIETALGGALRNIVTDNENTAKYLIEFLKATKAGRATFLPLTNIRPRKKYDRPEALREPGVIGLASSLIRCEERYDAMVNQLLGRTLVVDNIDHAIAIGRKYAHALNMVTLQGESFSPGGSITGGAFRNQENLLGRRREIDELTKRTRKLKKQLEETQRAIDEKRDRRNALRDEIVALGGSLQEQYILENTALMGKKQAEDAIRLNKLDRSSLEKESGEIDRQIEQVRSMSASIARELKASESEELRISTKTAELEAQAAGLQTERNAQSAALEEVHLKVAALRQKREYLKADGERLVREIRQMTAEKEDLAVRIVRDKKEIENKHRQIAEVQATIDAGEETGRADRQRNEELTAAREALRASNRAFFERRDELQRRLADLDKESFRLHSRKEKLEESMEASVTYLWEEYELTPVTARPFRDESLSDRQMLRREIGRIKDEIKKLGSVNVNAIEDYKNVLERHTFLTAQHADLVESEKTLEGIIAELDKGMRRQFSEQFVKINEQFDIAFRELFGGGHGKLEIEENVDVLEAGITIIAEPPGKKLQNMMQLSGGEKALTAIALLFAIQNMKPSPFCLLDEIEAALDDNNVGRYAGYLHKLTRNTQFIIITHRRGTMAAADRLYGITMQEKGVSTLVSVNLIEDKLDN